MKTLRADFVIVGGGTAGCVLAERLSEDPQSTVIVLETGSRHRGLKLHIPGAIAALYEEAAYHWPYVSAAEPYAGNKKLPYKMGRLVGGSSAINGMVWVRGNPKDFDDWAAAGNLGWDYASMARLFRRIESFEDDTDADMGLHGPIPVMRGRPEQQVLCNAFLKAAQMAGYPLNPNYNGRNQDGFCALHRNTRDGRRRDVYQGYIHGIRKRPNLKILHGHTVSRIELKDGVATGVIGTAAGKQYHVIADGEVILSAGSIASPQLLEVSGIGDPDHLKAANVPLTHALRGVGHNLHSHPTIKLTYGCRKPVSIYPATRPLGRLLAGVQWILSKSGPAATSHFEAGAFLRSHPACDRPDYQLTFLPLALQGTTGAVQGHGFQIYVELIGCKSRGHTHICSGDIGCQPAFVMNYLQDVRDIAVFTEAVRVVRKVVSQSAFEPFRGAEIEPGAQVSTQQDIAQWLRRTASLSHHLVGSCRMGPGTDPLAVVDSELRVHGIEHLRVADASIMPTITSGNTHATVVAIAENAADRIKETHGHASREAVIGRA
jgi:choline dehydrogenase